MSTQAPPTAHPERAASSSPGLSHYVVMPVVLGLSLLALYIYVSLQELDSIEQRSLNAARLTRAVWEHVQLTGVSTALTLLIAIPLGILLTRPFTRRIRPYIVTVLTVLQAVPTIAILVLLAVAFLFLGFAAAIVGLVLYAIVPVLLNTMVGLEQVDKSVLEAGRGMGMSRSTVLQKIELPLAIPVMLAGIRTALVINVGTAALVTYINAGGLGDIIVAGLSTNRITVQIVGAALTAILALLIDYLAGLIEEALRPRGL
ncbi:ABC transporter permease [Nesterenkonia sphaerica]|uniref:ABC transporter permease n=1 Tax=Nesterenkonia sphaerica TaxID=1804988 RepID=A0A5R9A4W7_9MICC|nr:ABC transporter permease [Nesterenkonia sphaerica]TLP72826.1 ABC transporter permease [Nesterenkonia sphaerica]